MIEAKALLDIDPNDASEDAKILILLEHASSIINEFLGTDSLELKSRTEYYSGSGTQKLKLKHRPVFTTPTIQMFIDSGGYWGSATDAFNATNTAKTYGTDFALKIDQADGTSRSGILIRLGDYWPKPQVRQVGYLSPFLGDGNGNVKVIYTAGWTIDTLPAPIRSACNLLTAKLLNVFPIGMELNSENYEERGLGIVVSEKLKLMSLVAQMLYPYKNWAF